MKSIDFKRKDSVIRVMNEDVKKPKRNWDRVVYIVFLSLLGFFIGYYLVNKVFFIKANGQVLFEDVNIRLTNDCRVLSYQKIDGDTVHTGDSLFTYTLDKDNLSGDLSQLSDIASKNEENQSDWIEKEKYALSKKIALNNIDVTETQALIKSYKGEIQRLENQATLDVLPKSRLEFVRTEVLRLNSTIEKLNGDNKQLNNLIKDLDNMFNKSEANNAQHSVQKNAYGNYEDGIRVFYSPFEGAVTHVFTRQYEVALKSDQIMSVHKNTPMYIKGFFEQKDINYFKEGDIVNVEFPDGTDSKGIIKQFYYNTYTLPEEFQKRYEPTTRTISADIYPVNDEDYAHWKMFYKMSVSITKFKY